jgi:hypothetical protein
MASMPTRKLVTLAAAVVALFALGFGSQLAEAKSAAPTEEAKKEKADRKAPTGGTAKAGEACKVDDDCDQSGRGMQCRRSKCEYDVSRIPAKT